MSDPYSILGVDRNATDEDVKKAYRKLSRQYHPDANINNPKKDEAEAKFKEVQQAYQQIMDEREKEYNSGYGSSDGSGYGSYGPFGGFGGFGSYGYGSAGSTGGTSGMSEEEAHLNAAANYIRSGHYKEALNVLAGISLPHGVQALDIGGRHLAEGTGVREDERALRAALGLLERRIGRGEGIAQRKVGRCGHAAAHHRDHADHHERVPRPVLVTGHPTRVGTRTLAVRRGHSSHLPPASAASRGRSAERTCS